MYNFTQEEYNSNAKEIEETTLIPDWLPKNWMSHVNRYGIAMHPSKSKLKGSITPTGSPQKRLNGSKLSGPGRTSQLGVGRQAAQQSTKSKSVSSPTKRRSTVRPINSRLSNVSTNVRK